MDIDDNHHIVRMTDYFVFRRHLVIVFELLSVSLYDLLKNNNFHSLSLKIVRSITKQLLVAMTLIQQANIIHCDLKPENVLFKSASEVKVIDFGSACFENYTVYSYIQSRFYRAPEVILGRPYDSKIDTWSLGCIAAELFIGIPLFPGNSEYD
mmetsp:Transcript_3115/g.1828  ORF Transcript_3115/g.1828 Transcript_3115/m.1828 type:complete len:153 (-) Transcript_3115:391-849(-)